MGEIIKFGRRRDDLKELQPLHPRMEIMIAQMEQLLSDRHEHRTEAWMRNTMLYTCFIIHVIGFLTILVIFIAHSISVISDLFTLNR